MIEIIVLDDNPKNCEECWISVQALFRTMPDVPSTVMCERLRRFCEADYEEKRPDWCPRRPLPEKRNTTSQIETKHEAEENHVTPQHQAGFNLGWNACLDAITGGEEE